MAGFGNLAEANRFNDGTPFLAKMSATLVLAFSEILFKFRKAEKELVFRKIFLAVEVET